MLSWMIGEVQITSIVESETPTSPRFMFENMTKSDVLERCESAEWLRPHFINDEGYLLQKIHCLVVQVGQNLIAVDTCVGNDKVRFNEMWNQQRGPFLEDFVGSGFALADVTHVICTHLHVDHVGWNTRLVDDRWLPTFPNADYLFVQQEFDHWQNEPGIFEDEDVFGDSVQPIVDAGLATLVSPTHEVCDEVWLEPTPGHTPGHVSVRIESAGDRAVITGDMTHNPLQMADPDLSSRFDVDPNAARDTRRAVFPTWADGETLVIGTHFGNPTAATMVPHGDGYRLLV